MKLNDSTLLRTDTYIDGRWQPAESGDRFDVCNPADGQVIAEVADGGASETRHAIAAAAEALPAWRALTGKARSAILRRLYELMIEHADDLGLIVTTEMGKPIPEGRGEIVFGANYVEWFAEEAKRTYGEIIPTHDPSMRLLVVKQPIGVVAAITPWNFPSSTITRKVVPALAAGCTVVAKPAEDTPLSALALAELAGRAGLPPGVLNVVTGRDPAPIGQVLTSSPTVRAISFTGSTELGKLLMRQSSETVKKVSLELGGNAPFVVFDDADLTAAVIIAKYRNGGQTCICSNRTYVQEGIYEGFVEQFSDAAAQLTVGSGLDDEVDIGPLINVAALDKVTRLVGDAVDSGASVRMGGQPHELGRTFYQPTVLIGVTGDMAIAREEVFGPVATIFRFQEEGEVVDAANDTPYGLAAYFFSRDVGRIWRVSEALEYGMVSVNSGLLMTEVAPFGGVKESGVGREGGRQGIDEFLEEKYVAMGGITT